MMCSLAAGGTLGGSQHSKRPAFCWGTQKHPPYIWRSHRTHTGLPSAPPWPACNGRRPGPEGGKAALSGELSGGACSPSARGRTVARIAGPHTATPDLAESGHGRDRGRDSRCNNCVQGWLKIGEMIRVELSLTFYRICNLVLNLSILVVGSVAS